MSPANGPSSTHLILIPSYDTGSKLFETIRAVCAAWQPVWVVIDGSTDGTGEELQERAGEFPGLSVLVLPRNVGKGAAILQGLREAGRQGFTHALTMDSDGQHAVASIADFMAASLADPNALVLGRPVFDDTAPWERVQARKLSNWGTNLETLWAGIGDSLFGMRVYPIAPLVALMDRHRWMRRFDFDNEAAVRLVWAGCTPVNVDTPVRYFREADGGVSHFNYLRDNILLCWMHARLFVEFLWRLPGLVRRQP